MAVLRSLLFAAAACAYIALADRVLSVLHARGVAQAFLSFCIALGSLIQLPGFWAAEILGLRRGFHVTTTGVWMAMLGFNLAFYSVVAFVLLLRASAGGRGTRKQMPASSSDKLVTRRRLITAGVGALGSGALGYSMILEPRCFEISRRVVPLRGLPPELSGLRLVQLTDLHHGPWMPLSHIEHVVQTTNELKPDILLLTGDYVHRSPAYIEPVVAVLSRLKPRIGTLAVLGNHDWWEDGPRSQREFAKVGIPLIDNGRRFITPDRRITSSAAVGLCIAGVGDYYADAQHYGRALAGIPADMPRLLLSHNPDVAEDRRLLAAHHRVDLMISGHTHGGQIHVPGLGTPVVPSAFGQKYASGLVQGPACPVFVCRGIGLTVLPVRLGVRPELAILELKAI